MDDLHPYNSPHHSVLHFAIAPGTPRELVRFLPATLRAHVDPVPLFVAFLLFSCHLCAQAQINCDTRWSSIRWQGKFTVKATANGTDASGSIIQVNNFVQASFDRNYLLGTTLFTNDFGTLNQTATTSCAPAQGQQILKYSGSGRLTPGSTIDIVPKLLSCTYDLTLSDTIIGDFSVQVCDSGTVDLGTSPYSLSLGRFVSNLQLRDLPLPPFGQPLAGQITDTSIDFNSVPATVTLSWNITPLSIRITSVQTPTFLNNRHTFISTDAITLQATVSPAVAGVPVEWTASGINAAAGITGFPKNESHDTDGSGLSSLLYTPDNNPRFLNNRRTRWTAGSRAANPPIAFEIEAALEQGGIASTLSQTTLGSLEEDEIDTLRQEYVDIQQPVPARQQVVPSLGAPWNGGNYNVQLDNNLKQHFNAILASYRGRSVTNAGQAITIPADAQLVVSSGYRSPQLNKAIGSVHPESLHTRGRALDLEPMPVTVIVGGTPTALGLHEALYPALAGAVSAQSLHPLPEQSAVPVPLGDSRENHIHVQW